MRIEFLSSVAVIAPEPSASRELYVGALGLPLASGADEEYHHSEQIGGCKHFAVWPLSQAAEACFGSRQWPAISIAGNGSCALDLLCGHLIEPRFIFHAQQVGVEQLKRAEDDQDDAADRNDRPRVE